MQDLLINGRPSEISIFASDELARSVMISLFLGLEPTTTMRSKGAGDMAFGAIHMAIREKEPDLDFGF